MPIIHCPCCAISPFFTPRVNSKSPSISSIVASALAKTDMSRLISCRTLHFSFKSANLGPTHIPLCSNHGVFEELRDGDFVRKGEDEEYEELELLDKPYLKLVDNGSVAEIEENESRRPSKDEALEPFYKFFKSPGEEVESGEGGNESFMGENEVTVEYYEPKQGDLVVGVVVSGNENKLDVSVGADLLGLMLTKEVLPLYDKEMSSLLWDAEKDAGSLVRGKVGIMSNDEALSCEPTPGRPVVEPGTVLFAEVLGRTLGGRPLLSTRKLFRRIAWHRARQIKQLNEPLEIKITEWNTGGLLTRIEGLRAFLPKTELINKVNSFTELKENVGRRIYVQITRINEDNNELVLSEKEAWAMMHLQEGTLLDGTVQRIFPYGAQIRIGDTNRSGLLHISNISRERIVSIEDLLAVDEKVKVLVVRSPFPDKISLSIAALESEPGLFLSNKEKVFSEAETMAKKYRQKLSAAPSSRKLEALPTDSSLFQDEEKLYANWEWFIFQREMDMNP